MLLTLLSPANLRHAAIALAIALLVAFGASWASRGRHIAALEMEKASLVTQLQAADYRLHQAQLAAGRLTERLQEREAARTEIERIEEEVIRATEDQDGPVAPVLRDAIGGLERLREPATTADRTP